LLRLNLSFNDNRSLASSDRGSTVGEATSPVVQADRRTTPRRCALDLLSAARISRMGDDDSPTCHRSDPASCDTAWRVHENIDLFHAGQGTESCMVTS
jgi:hypothetical protein